MSLRQINLAAVLFTCTVVFLGVTVVNCQTGSPTTRTNGTDNSRVKFLFSPRWSLADRMRLLGGPLYGFSLGQTLSSQAAFSVPSFAFLCQSGVLDSNETNSCIQSLNFTVTPWYVETSEVNQTVWTQGQAVTVESTRDSLDDMRVTCGQIGGCDALYLDVDVRLLGDDTYVYTIPMFRYCPPTSFCTYSIEVSEEGNQAIFESKDPTVLNPFNATTQTIRELYGVPESVQGKPSVVQGTSIGGTSISTEAIDAYMGALGIVSRPLVFAFGTSNNETTCDAPGTCLEEILDGMALIGMAPNATTFFQPGESGLDDKENALLGILKWLNELISSIKNSDVKPDVISLSWGADYPGDVQSLSDYGDTIDELEKGLEELAMMNITVVVGPGDVGASGNTVKGCATKKEGGLFYTWPGMSPWVVSVGGTDVRKLSPDSEPQEVVLSSTSLNSNTTTAGGFSAKNFNYETPEWQQSAVADYLKNNGPTTFSGFPTEAATPSFNPSGRAFPDVAAYGAFIPFILGDGSIKVLSGTSLSAPLVASMFTMANQILTETGYQTIGYANPMLYWMGENCPSAFKDVTFGDNKGTLFGETCDYGFKASNRWDPVSGWGTIQFEPFVECVMQYQDTQKAFILPKENESNISSPNNAASSPRDFLYFEILLAGILLLII